MPLIRLTILALTLLATAGAGRAQRNILERIIRQESEQFGTWAKDPTRYDIQVLYTQIDRDRDNRPSFTTYRYGVDANRYYYPASTVKMPAAFLALEKLNHLGIIGLDANTPMRIGATRPPQTPVVTDATAPALLPTVGHYVRKIFLASDNDAFNRLYEFLGQRYFNERLRELGYGRTRIIHRLSVSGFDTVGNRYTNPVSFYRYDTLLYHQHAVYSRFYEDFGLDAQMQGQAYIDDQDRRVAAPFDFRFKNYVALQDLHDMLRAVIFPEAVPAERRFDLSAADYALLYRAMGQRPAESDYPKYAHEPDNYVKFWLYGDRDSTYQIPASVRIFNKVGWAYGFLTDVAYIVDLERNVEFILAGTIRVNANETFNDGVYEYDEVGLPFFGELGRAVYAYELERRRRRSPDLARFRLNFDEGPGD